ncbi:hypothetical protein [Mammaliicoccus sciuri]|uniref:hypothetical protein n=1 Tax=Mammaliicoccus sciuri TaxID=1296 RepID=UPI002DBC56E5|nr:hypothetical protein [Mammaliicoccus sciuri]MEB6231427.1 hypothetical protein [Mammaliicoccus sciuri]
MGHPRKTKAKERMIELYIELAHKKVKTPDEKIIFELIEPYCLYRIEKSIKYYYELYENHAKVGIKSFYYRYYRLGYSKWDALTLDHKEVKRLRAKKLRETLKEKREDKNISETEQDIIRFVDNGLVLNRRQLKYIESNPAFAEKLKNRKVEC